MRLSGRLRRYMKVFSSQNSRVDGSEADGEWSEGTEESDSDESRSSCYGVRC